jgi:hypothetical protein
MRQASTFTQPTRKPINLSLPPLELSALIQVKELGILKYIKPIAHL